MKRNKLKWLCRASNLSLFAFFPGSLVILSLIYISSPYELSFSQFLPRIVIGLGWIFLSVSLLRYFHKKAEKLMEEVLTDEEKWDRALRQALRTMTFMEK